ncbi:MAG: HAD family hydrolase [Verrucomicrobiota bacterium]
MKDCFVLTDYTAAIFDLDGTLLNTLEDIADAANRTLKHFGHPTHEVDAFRSFVGSGPDTLFQRALETNPDDSRIPELVDHYKQEYAEQADRKTCLYPGIAELLDALTKKEIKLAILTNKWQHAADQCVATFLDCWNWDCVVGYQPPRPKKPDPSGALQILETLNCPPRKCFYLGDSDIDMKTAVAAGVVPVGVTWGFRDREELVQAGAQEIIAHPLKIFSIQKAAHV